MEKIFRRKPLKYSLIGYTAIKTILFGLFILTPYALVAELGAEIDTLRYRQQRFERAQKDARENQERENQDKSNLQNKLEEEKKEEQNKAQDLRARVFHI